MNTGTQQKNVNCYCSCSAKRPKFERVIGMQKVVKVNQLNFVFFFFSDYRLMAAAIDVIHSFLLI